ncbi:MAG: FxsA family protein [Nocardioides sp.]
MSRRRRLSWWVLVVAFVVVPLVEIVVLIQVGQVIGPWWTVLLLVADSIVGGWLVKREGARTWRALSEALASGRMPAREIADGALVLVGGGLMLTPGFVTDVLGALLVLPVTRPVARRLLAEVVARRLVIAGVPHSRAAGGSGGSAQRGPGPASSGPVVQGEVVDDDQTRPRADGPG